MKSKLNRLRKEQKRLRRCMRGYQRKLRESQQSEHDMQGATTDKSQKKPKNSTIVNHNDDNNTSETGRVSKTFAKSRYEDSVPDKTRTRPNASSASLAEKQTLFVENKFMTLSARSCDPSFSQHTTGSQQADDSSTSASFENQAKYETNKSHPIFIENVGRTVRKGSGKIGASSRQVHVSVAESELKDDAFEDLSDSSDEEGGEPKKYLPIDVVSFRNGVFVREITPLTLMKGNTAYFQSASKEMNTVKIEESQKDPELSGCDKEEAITVGISANRLHSNSGISDLKKEQSHIQTKCSQTELIGIPLKSLAVASHQIKEAHKPKPDESKDLKKRKEKVGVSFNDIIKIQISNNTKKLFSLVDRLAKTNGIPETPVQQQSKARLARKDPRENVATMRRAQAAKAGFVASDITTHGSVYYAIKYGYSSDGGISGKTQDVSRPTSTEGRERDRTRTPGGQSVSTKSYLASNSETLSNTMSVISLSQNDNTMLEKFRTPLSCSESEEGRHLPIKTYDDDISTELASFLSQQKEKQRNKRRSNILEASKYVTAVRRRSVIANYGASSVVSEHYKRERELFIRQRRDSTKPEHVQVSNDHKEPWTSAFGRIKMMHTLADLTHIL